jgi:hypothetical protein
LKIVINNVIPFKGFQAINLFGIVFARNELSAKSKNHEAIHTAQMKEMLYIFFYIFYLVEWLVRLCLGKNAYYKISYEQEAYLNQNNLDYLETRKPYAWAKYLLINKK